ALCLLDSGDLCAVDFDGLAQHIYGPRDHYEIDVAMRTKNGNASFGIAAFLLSFAKSNVPSSPSEAGIHTDCSIGQYGLKAAIHHDMHQSPLRGETVKSLVTTSKLQALCPLAQGPLI
ncbi:MAG: hypothetical protein P8P76_06895, partial [Alphaproteobacteria bacterium]|nr:hypothetical protein [Alphaproteobacteria bacterium]